MAGSSQIRCFSDILVPSLPRSAVPGTDNCR
jgi:ABC-type arginine transport system permease subunit